MATSTALAVVVTVSGQVVARSEHGQVRTLRVGDRLAAGEVVLTARDAQVELAFADNERLTIDGNRTVTLTGELVEALRPSIDEAELQPETADDLIATILGGGEFEQLLEATAAGPGGAGDGGDGSSFVRLLRITEAVSGNDYEFANAKLGASTSPESDDSQRAPAAAADFVSTDEDTPLLIDVLTNDTDPNGDSLTITGVTQGNNGSVSLDPQSGLPIYTPNPDFNGTDSFSYTISDPAGNTSTATVVVTVTPINDAPVANPDARDIGEDDASISGNVITAPNAGEQADTDLDGDTLAVSAVAFGATVGTVGNALAGDYGVLTLNADGSYSYSPNAAAQALDDGETGIDVFSYTVSDGSATDSTTLTVTVTGSNDVPIAVADTGATPEDTPVTIAVLDNDSDPDGDPLSVIEVDGQAISVGSPVTITEGTVALNADGTLTFTPNPNFNGPVEFSYTISDGDDTASATVSINVTPENDGPQVTDTTNNVSEEGLPNGLADTQGTIDTTDANVITGHVNIEDADGDPISSIVLTAPTSPVSSGGETVTWSGSGTNTLTGSVAGTPVATLTIDSNGDYTLSLTAPIDHPDTSSEDTLTLEFGIVASDGTTSDTGLLTITVEDDAPHAAPDQHQMGLLDTNLLLIIDVSGSMGTGDGINGETRLQTAIASLNSVLDGYDDFGGVAVRIVSFSSGATAIGSGWTDVDTARAQLAALSSGGTTNYDAALDTAQTAFGSSGALSNAQNVVYFLSDGRPNRPSDSAGINASEEAEWIEFLESNLIHSYALGMGTGVDQSNLDPIAYDGQSGTNTDAILVTDFNQLESTLLGTVPDPVSGELLSTVMNGETTGIGADGGYIQSVTAQGTTYHYDPSGGGSVSVSGGPDNGSFDAATQTLVIATALGGTFEIDLDDGHYSYAGPDSVASSATEIFDYTVIDGDGDTASSSVMVDVERTNVQSGTDDADVLSGDDGPDLIMSRAGDDIVSGEGGADRLLGDGDNDSLDGGAGNDQLLGSEGNDALTGGPGDDLLGGGIGADTLVWNLADRGDPGTPAVDTVEDFDNGSGGDVLELSDLLQGENPGNLTNYLHVEISGDASVLQISSIGGFAGGYDSDLVDQRIILEGVDLSAGGALANDSQIIQDLLGNGNLITD